MRTPVTAVRRHLLKRRDFLNIFRPSDEPQPSIHGAGDRSRRHAARTAGWKNFNMAFPEGANRHFVIEGARVAIGPGRVVVRADAPMALLEPRTWTAEGERFLQFFYRSITEDEIHHDPDHPEAILLMEGERWTEEWEESVPSPGAPGERPVEEVPEEQE